MKCVFVLFIVSLSFGCNLHAVNKLPIIKATSQKASIRDGSLLKANFWRLSPQIKPDIYVTTSQKHKVTFITDIDSISFVAAPEKEYNFIVLLNGKDTALTQIKCIPDYLKRLKKGATYNYADQRTMPPFTYQSADNQNLADLRAKFKLDSIAAKGSEVSKILNLLHWVHNLIPHDGNHPNPEAHNAVEMIAVCKKEHRGLNCRGLATVLNECYLSLGIKSRFITCMPKDSLFNDCHVINMVYSGKLKKWLWIDPTNDAYVMNEKGELLSIQEVRERIINGKPLLLNPEANWNHLNSVNKEEYLYSYMAKNLYRMECPVTSEYNAEARVPGKTINYIELQPLDADKIMQEKSEFKNSQTGTTFLIYKTNNPRLFWAQPE